jgi:hypothetical protein
LDATGGITVFNPGGSNADGYVLSPSFSFTTAALSAGNSVIDIINWNYTAVPEPQGSAWIAGLGLAAFSAVRRLRR